MAELLGIIIAAAVMFFIGRKKSVIVSVIIILFTALVHGSNYNKQTRNVASLMHHTAITLHRAVHLIYICEIAEPKFRLLFICLASSPFFLGFLMGHILDTRSTLIFMIAGAIGTAAWVLSIHIPESPYYLAFIGKEGDAQKSFKYLRGGVVDDDEFDDILDEADRTEEHMKGIIHKMMTLQFLIPLSLYCSMKFAEEDMCSLIEPTMFYVKQRYRISTYPWSVKLKGIYLEQIAVGVFPLVGSLTAGVASLFFGRRIIFLVALLFNITITSTYLLVFFAPAIFLKVGPFCRLFTYSGTLQIPRLLAVELFPAVLREVGVTTCLFIDVIFQRLELFTTFSTRVVVTSQMFLRFRWILIPLGIFIFIFFTPETKDLTMKEAADMGSDLRVYFMDLEKDKDDDEDDDDDDD